MKSSKKTVRRESRAVADPAEVQKPKSVLKSSSRVIDASPRTTQLLAKARAPVAAVDDDDFGTSSISVLGVNTAAPTEADLMRLLGRRDADLEVTPDDEEREAKRKREESKSVAAAAEAARPLPKPAAKKSKISVRAVAPASNLNATNMQLAMQRLFAAPPSALAPSAPEAAPGLAAAAMTADVAEKQHRQQQQLQLQQQQHAEASQRILASLHPKLQRPLKEQMKILQLTRVQQLAWEPMLDKERDVLVRSETGSGKTLSYALPLVHQLLTACDQKPVDRSVGMLICVLVPTRELSLQVAEVLEVLCRNARFLVVGAIHGGESRHKEKARLRKGVHILVATPGRLLDHLKTTNSFTFKNLQSLVFDEADRLLDMGFERPIREIMEIISPSKRALVSATITKAVERLSHVTLRDPVHVGETEDVFQVPKSLRQHYVQVPCKHRLATLAVFLLAQLKAGSRKLVVFCSTSDAVEFHYLLFSRVQNPFQRAEMLRKQSGSRYAAGEKRPRVANRRLTAMANQHRDGEGGGDALTLDDDDEARADDEIEEMVARARAAAAQGRDPAAAADADAKLDSEFALFKCNLYKLHGNMSQVDRAAVFHSFKTTDDAGVLFCTDVAARGLDMPRIDWIVHYDPPTDERCYIHRVGRTARIGHVGDSILFLQPHEVGYARHLEQFIEAKLEEKRQEGILLFLSTLDKTPGHYWVQSTATLQRQFAYTVTHDDALSRVAMFAYQSYVRAYAGFPAALKRFFPQTELHLGHVATSFAIDAKPSELRRKLKLNSVVKEERAMGRDMKRFGASGSGMEVDTREQYHSTLVRQQVQRTKEYFIEERERRRQVPRPLEFTEFDA